MRITVNKESLLIVEDEQGIVLYRHDPTDDSVPDEPLPPSDLVHSRIVHPTLLHNIVIPGGQWNRIGMYGSAIYHDGKIHLFTCANDASWGWHMVGMQSNDGKTFTSPVHIMDNCQCCSIEYDSNSGNWLGMFSRGDNYYTGKTTDPLRWDNLERYENGFDVCARSNGLLVHKSTDWSSGQDRFWYANRYETTGLNPSSGVEGSIEFETYAVTISRFEDIWFGLQSAFFVKSETSGGTERGVIYPLFIASSNGTDWRHVYDRTPAINRVYDGMIVAHTQPIRVDDKVMVYYWESNYQHAMATQVAKRLDSLNCAVWSASDWDGMARYAKQLIDGGQPVPEPDDDIDYPRDDWESLKLFADLPRETIRHYASAVPIKDGEPDWWIALYNWRQDHSPICPPECESIWYQGDIDKDGYRNWSATFGGRQPGPGAHIFKNVRLTPTSIAPDMLPDGTVRSSVTTVPHVLLHPMTPALLDSSLQMDTTYYVAARVRVSTAEWIDGWGLWMQFWGPGYANHKAKNPPLAIDPRGKVYQYGATGPSDTDEFPINGSRGNLWDMDTDWHDFVVMYKPSQSNGITRVYRDGVLVYDYAGVNTIHPTIGPILSFGLYAATSKSTPAITEIQGLRLLRGK